MGGKTCAYLVTRLETTHRVVKAVGGLQSSGERANSKKIASRATQWNGNSIIIIFIRSSWTDRCWNHTRYKNMWKCVSLTGGKKTANCWVERYRENIYIIFMSSPPLNLLFSTFFSLLHCIRHSRAAASRVSSDSRSRTRNLKWNEKNLTAHLDNRMWSFPTTFSASPRRNPSSNEMMWMGEKKISIRNKQHLVALKFRAPPDQ